MSENSTQNSDPRAFTVDEMIGVIAGIVGQFIAIGRLDAATAKQTFAELNDPAKIDLLFQMLGVPPVDNTPAIKPSSFGLVPGGEG